MSTSDDAGRRVAEIRERAEKATPGPWTWKYNGICGPKSLFGAPETTRNGEAVIDLACDDCGGRKVQKAEDRDFIAHARMDVPWLLDRVEVLEAALRDVVEATPQFVGDFGPDGLPESVRQDITDFAGRLGKAYRQARAALGEEGAKT